MKCLHCKSTFKPTNTRGPKRTKFCSPKCTYSYRNQKRSPDRHKYCPICETVFYDDSVCNNKTYCSEICASKKGFYLKYGLNALELSKLATECQICGAKDDLCVDHCHKMKHIRGILCRNCNTGIGLLKDSVQTLKSAILYLKNN